MDIQKIWLKNIKIHYIWSIFSSIMFLSPIITLYYKYYWLTISNILLISSVFYFFLIILEIPTSTLWDTRSRVKVLKLSAISWFIKYLLLFALPGKYIFFVAAFFSALSQALWSGTGHAKLQEDLNAAWLKDNYWKILWRLISLNMIGQLITPIWIYFILNKFPWFWFHILAWLDILFRTIASIFVMNFKEINFNTTLTKSFKENLNIHWHTFISTIDYIKNTKKIQKFILLLIFWTNFAYITTIFLPTIKLLWVKDSQSWIIIGISVAIIMLSSWFTHHVANKFSYKKLFWLIMLANAIIHILFAININNLYNLIWLYFIFCFVLWLYWTTWNHIFMNLIDIENKATLRSILLSAVFLYQAIIFFLFWTLNVQTSIFIIFAILIIWLYFNKKFEKDI